jgi:aminodeoxyfutalosine deaminase
MNSFVVVHRAPWLLPICHPLMEDGGIAVSKGKIQGVGRFSAVRHSWPGARVIDHPDAVLLPGLINAHTHLELSHLAHLAHLPAPASFTDWLLLLLAERAKAAVNIETATERIAAAASTVLEAQNKEGVAAVANISNTGLCFNLAKDFNGRLLCFSEYIGLRAEAADAILLSLQSAADSQLCTGHAIYSTHPYLLRGLKARAFRLGHIFPIHTAECAAEVELLRTGQGELRDFLDQRGWWDHSLPLAESGVVTYLHRHGLLDSKTLCVHCVHIDEAEADLLAAAKAKVCLCPGSNGYLGIGRAPLALLRRKGILPALGTDSLASNPELSLWREMRLLAAQNPSLPPAELLAMATLGGAAALGLDDQLGTLEPGKDAVILAAELRAPASTAEGIQEQLVQQGGRCPLYWL